MNDNLGLLTPWD